MKGYPKWFSPYVKPSEPYRQTKEITVLQDVASQTYYAPMSFEELNNLKQDATHLDISVTDSYGDTDIFLKFQKYVTRPNPHYNEKSEEDYKRRYEEYKEQSKQWKILKKQWEEEKEIAEKERRKNMFEKLKKEFS